MREMRAARQAAILTIIAILSGCAPWSGLSGGGGGGGGGGLRAGTFATVSPTVAEAVAQDGVNVLSDLFGPGVTRIVYSQSMESAFADEMEQRIRAKGYAVDYDVRGEGEGDGDTKTVILRYVLDNSGHMIRLTLVIWRYDTKDFTVLSRGYGVRKGSVVPAGAWTKRG